MPRLRSVLRRAAGRFIPRFAPPVKCLSCGRDRDAGARLIAGPDLYVCTECIAAELPTPAQSDAAVTVGVCRWCRAWRFSSQLVPVRGIPTCSCCRENLAVLAARGRSR